MQTKAHGIMFHHFSKENYNPKHQGAISADDLAKLIEYLGVKHILSARQWLEKAENGTLTDRDICLTFDDALMSQYNIALPVLENYALTGFWFVYTKVIEGEVEMFEIYRKFRTEEYENINDFYHDFFAVLDNSKYRNQVIKALRNFITEKYLIDFPFYSENDKKFRFIRDKVLDINSYKEIMNLMLDQRHIDIKRYSSYLWLREKHLKQLHRKGHLIGLHSHTHPMFMGDLNQSEQKLEYDTNFRILEKVLSERPRTMSHPCNSYTKATLSILKSLGIKIGFRANMVKIRGSSLEYPREDHMNLIREMKK